MFPNLIHFAQVIQKEALFGMTVVKTVQPRVTTRTRDRLILVLLDVSVTAIVHTLKLTSVLPKNNAVS